MTREVDLPGKPIPKEVTVKSAKGRPMLQWAGKRTLDRVKAYPAQHIETFDPSESLTKPGNTEAWRDWPLAYPKSGLLFHGENKDTLGHLLANGFRGRVQSVYIDPPFDSGADYVRKVQLRGLSHARMEGEGQSVLEQVQYTDLWADDSYLQFLYERFQLISELLKPEGFLFVHLDSNRAHYARVILDEIFGAGCFLNEIIWQGTSAHNDPGRFGRVHNNILLYGKGGVGGLATKLGERSRSYLERWFKYAMGPHGEILTLKPGEAPPAGYRRFRLSDLRSPNPRPNLMYLYKGYRPHPNGWAVSPERMKRYETDGRLHFPTSLDGRIQLRNYLDAMDLPTLQDMWWEIAAEADEAELAYLEGLTDTWRFTRTLQGGSNESTGYPTQKPEALLERIISASSAEGDIILDCFSGSGTTAVVSQRLGRRWICCDINRGAIQATSRRLQALIARQASGPQALNEEMGAPMQLAFTVWRVNDYDLQIQHNEAVALTCDFIGVEQLRSDPYFDGTLGKSLVKVVPFNHPLTPVDLEELKRELDARSDEDRSVTLVCLGIELASQGWIDEWNRLRRGANSINRIEVIELRTDARYGGVIRHEAAQARVSVIREGGRIKINILDFISPTIIQRLQQQGGLMDSQIDDWRSMVDSVAIDTAYDGTVLNVVLADIPEKKADLVSGTYDLEAPAGDTVVAVKMIDMLGEEVLVTEKL